MKWSPQQAAALDAAGRWLKNKSGPQVFRLFGFAGTGKTTLMRHLAESAGPGVIYAAFTAKAALVMRSMGCVDAGTIHSKIYRARSKSSAILKEMESELARIVDDLGADASAAHELRFRIRAERIRLSKPGFDLNEASDVARAPMVGIDECSMVGDQMGKDLLSFGRKVLVLGDPAQLPPVKGGGFFTNATPDVMLTEIHRQAAENPIIRLATAAREHRPFDSGDYSPSRIVRSIEDAELVAADQVLVGLNRTRHMRNANMRKALGRDGDPQDGDKVICLRNDYEIGVFNGSLWRVTGCLQDPSGFLGLDIDDENGERSISVMAHPHIFAGDDDKVLTWWERCEAQEFDFGYAITVHKSQGSQWPRVVLFDESAWFREHNWRWLYTGITRAREALVVVQNGGAA